MPTRAIAVLPAVHEPTVEPTTAFSPAELQAARERLTVGDGLHRLLARTAPTPALTGHPRKRTEGTTVRREPRARRTTRAGAPAPSGGMGDILLDFGRRRHYR